MNAKSITNVAVLGLGTMGHGIAQAMAVAGCRVRGFDAHVEARESTLDRIQSNLHQLVGLDLLEQSEVPQILDRIEVCDSEEAALEDAQFVTEAVIEDLELKKRIFERIEAFVATDTILASNTSSYPMTEISERMQRRERTVVTHWFNPPHVIPVVEVVPGRETSDETAKTSYQFLERVGKTAVRVNQELPGFLVNRVQVAMFREIWDLMDRGIASPEDIDRAIRGSMGLRLAALGPLEIIDYAGWDVTARVFQNLIPDCRSDHEVPASIQEFVAAGHFGAKTGHGVFEYPAESLAERIALRDETYLKLNHIVEQSSRDGAS